MVAELLIPGMKDLDDTRHSPQILFVGRQLEKCFRTTFVKERVKKFLVTIQKRVQFMRKRKDHMKVRGIDYFGATTVYPDFFENSLAVRAVAVTAGIAVNFRMPAFCTSG